MRNRIGLVAAAVLFAGGANAQFAGDVYFSEPSLAVVEGEAGRFEVVTFTGSAPLGAVHVELRFDPDRLELVDAGPGSSSQFADAFVYEELEPGRVAFVTLNHTSLTDPFGTVSLAEVDVRPLLSAGNRADVDLTVVEMLDTDSSPFARRQGLGGEVVVVSAGAGRPAALSGTVAGNPSPLRILAQDPLENRAGAMGRPGQTVNVMRLEQYPGGIGASEVPIMVEPIPSIESAGQR